MIKTREDFRQINGILADLAPDEHEELFDLIEALRRFVRAHDKLDAARIGAIDTMSLEKYNALVEEFTAARRDLPDWITHE